MTSSPSRRNATCAHNDIAEKLLTWHSTTITQLWT